MGTTTFGDYIFLTGGTAELGNWSTTWDGAVGPMLAPNFPNWFLNVGVPAGQTIEFKFLNIAGNGAVTLGIRRQPSFLSARHRHRLYKRRLAELGEENRPSSHTPAQQWLNSRRTRQFSPGA